MKALPVAGTAFLIALALCACAPGRLSTRNAYTNWQPWTNKVTTAKELAFALEVRWKLELIQAHCDATPPTPDTVQNLVVLGEECRGTLHEGKPSGFDRIWWYASTRCGTLDKYSVNAAKGRKHWIIEIGDEQTLARSPVWSRK